jgi:hypothetical protein
MPPQRVALPEVFPELQAAMERRVRQLSDELSAAYQMIIELQDSMRALESKRSDELSAACQKIIELQNCKRTEASMLAFLQDAISASHSHDSNRLIASAMADLHQKIIATL